MTGEITLQGARAPDRWSEAEGAGCPPGRLRDVVLPKRNGPDLDDVPEHVSVRR